MKRIFLSTTAIAIFVGFIALPKSTWGQAPRPAAPTAPAAKPAEPEIPHRIALVDMANVFKEYKKFNAMRDELKGEIEQQDLKAKEMIERSQGIQQQMSQLKAGSPDYVALENQLIKIKGDFEAFKATAQREFLRKEATIYKTVYSEVEDAIRAYADHYNYTLVMRFSREELPDQSDPKGVLTGMNKQVIYWREKDDITDNVVYYLNNRYTQSSGKPAANPNPQTSQRPTAPPKR